jgi:hypothetical protein
MKRAKHYTEVLVDLRSTPLRPDPTVQECIARLHAEGVDLMEAADWVIERWNASWVTGGLFDAPPPWVTATWDRVGRMRAEALGLLDLTPEDVQRLANPPDSPRPAWMDEPWRPEHNRPAASGCRYCNGTSWVRDGELVDALTNDGEPTPGATPCPACNPPVPSEGVK